MEHCCTKIPQDAYRYAQTICGVVVNTYSDQKKIMHSCVSRQVHHINYKSYGCHKAVESQTNSLPCGVTLYQCLKAAYR